jgi:PAS domain S-box-containing protein
LSLLNNFFLYLTIVPTILNAWIILYILFVLPRGKATSVFTLFVISLFLWQLETIVTHLCKTEAQVIYWDKIFSIGWISLAPLVFHFACRFAGLKLLTRPLELILAYLPFFIFHQLHTAGENAHFIQDERWGWLRRTDRGSAHAMFRYTMAIYVMTAVGILIRNAYKKRNDRQKRTAAYLIAIGSSIPAIQGIVTQVVFPYVLHWEEIPVTTTFLTFFSAASLISLSRFRMFNISETISVETVLSNLKNIVIFISTDQKIHYMNPYASRLFNGVKEWQNKTVPIGKIFSSDVVYGQFVNDVFNRNLEGHIVKKYTTSFNVNDNEIIDVLVSVNPVLNNGHIEGMLLVGNDITEQLRTIAALKHSNERFNIVCKATNDMVWEWDLETGEVYRNKEGWRKLFHHVPESEISSPKLWEAMVHPEDRDKMNVMKEQILSSTENDFFEIESRIIRTDGSIGYVHDRGFVLRNKDNKAIRLIGAAQDITARKLAEKKLMEEQLRKQHEITDAVIVAQEKEREKIGGELHDNVNQLLASSLLYLNLAHNQGNNRADLFEKVNAMVNEAIVEIRKLSHSIIPPSLNASSLSGALENLVDSAHISGLFTVNTDLKDFNESNISEKLKLTIYRIAQEQFNNIIKYSGATRVDMKLTNRHGDITFIISDNGKGFNPGERSKGVGLMNISSRAALHKGRMKIISSPGQGCLLQVNFPLQQETEEKVSMQDDTVLYQ